MTTTLGDPLVVISGQPSRADPPRRAQAASAFLIAKRSPRKSACSRDPRSKARMSRDRRMRDTHARASSLQWAESRHRGVGQCVPLVRRCGGRELGLHLVGQAISFVEASFLAGLLEDEGVRRSCRSIALEFATDGLHGPSHALHAEWAAALSRCLFFDSDYCFGASVWRT